MPFFHIHHWPFLCRIVGLVWIACIVTACSKMEKSPEVAYLESTTLPSRLAVMPTTFTTVKKSKTGEFPVDPNSAKGKFISDLSRGVIHNQLTGKGYAVSLLSVVDKDLEGMDISTLSPQEVCDRLGVQGLVYPEIAGATMVTGVAYDLFKIDAKITLINAKGKQLGAWSDNASKRKIALPTSPISVATTIAGALLDESARKQMRMVIYDWGWKVTQFVPESPRGTSMPEVVSVSSNIDKGIFRVGDKIVVDVIAEKNLSCTFNLGDFKTSLPLSDSGDGSYKGVYVVQQGDRVDHQPLSVNLFRANGVKRVWTETGGLVAIDGVAPPAPEKIQAQAGRKGIFLDWTLPQEADLKEFRIEKNEKAVGTYAVVTTTSDLNYLDTQVSQGKTYYYRIRSVDSAGNLSSKYNTVSVIMPQYDEVTLTGAVSGSLVSGIYRVKGDATVNLGNNLSIGAGARIIMEENASLTVEGILKVKGTPKKPVIFSGKGWKGIVVTQRGEAEIMHASLRGGISCAQITGGRMLMQHVFIKRFQKDAITLQQDGVLTLDDGKIQECRHALSLEGGTATIAKTTMTKNAIGIDIDGAALSISKSNIYGNTEKDIRTNNKIIMEDNYLGATSAKALQLEGDVLVKSLLDAPYPHGQTIVLTRKKKERRPEVSENRFEQYKKDGIQAFREKRFGDAYQALARAMKIKADKDLYLYMAYTQDSMGETEQMLETLDNGISAFPYEVRLYQIYVKYLAAQGQKEKALSLLEQAVKLNPEDQGLVFIKEYVEDMAQ